MDPRDRDQSGDPAELAGVEVRPRTGRVVVDRSGEHTYLPAPRGARSVQGLYCCSGREPCVLALNELRVWGRRAARVHASWQYRPLLHRSIGAVQKEGGVGRSRGYGQPMDPDAGVAALERWRWGAHAAVSHLQWAGRRVAPYPQIVSLASARRAPVLPAASTWPFNATLPREPIQECQKPTGCVGWNWPASAPRRFVDTSANAASTRTAPSRWYRARSEIYE